MPCIDLLLLIAIKKLLRFPVLVCYICYISFFYSPVPTAFCGDVFGDGGVSGRDIFPFNPVICWVIIIEGRRKFSEGFSVEGVEAYPSFVVWRGKKFHSKVLTGSSCKGSHDLFKGVVSPLSSDLHGFIHIVLREGRDLFPFLFFSFRHISLLKGGREGKEGSIACLLSISNPSPKVMSCYSSSSR